MTDNKEITTAQSPEVQKAELTLTLSKAGLSYQTILQEGENIKFTRDNYESERLKLEELEKLEKKLKGEPNPWKDKWQRFNEARKSLVDPVSEILVKKKVDLAKIANEIAAEKKKIDDEAIRVKGIKDSMADFKTIYAGKISEAKTLDELVAIERLINLETANGKKYAEYLQTFRIECEPIRKLLHGQKQKIKELVGLEKQELEASENGDDEAILQIRDKKEGLEAEIHQTGINVQETALNQATNATEPAAAEIILPDIKGKRRTWDFSVPDIAALYKKAPEFVELVVDKEKVKAILKKKIEDGETKGISEFEHLNGLIKYFVKTSY